MPALVAYKEGISSGNVAIGSSLYSFYKICGFYLQKTFS